MAIFAPPAHGSGSTAYQISNSLRFDGSDDYLSRTFGTPTSNTTWTFSCWVKRGKLSATMDVMSAATDTDIYFNSSNQLSFYKAGTGIVATSTALFRDPTAHGHLSVISNGTTVKGYWNNAEVLSYTGTLPNINSAVAHYFGRAASALTSLFDGYLSDIYFIDGQALAPTDFGETNADGVWVPKAYTGTYGNNGFHLDFSDGTSTTTLGYDAAGSNDWTLSGMTRAAGVNECWMVDTPTDNFATWNTLWNSPTYPPTYADANLKVTSNSSGAGQGTQVTTFPISASGNWWVEVTAVTVAAAAQHLIGIVGTSFNVSASGDNQFAASSVGYGYNNDGNKRTSATNTVYGSTWDDGDVIGIHLSGGTLTFYKQTGGTGSFVSQGTAWSGLSGDFYIAVAGYSSDVFVLNAGQRTFNYVTQHGALPSSALPLSTANLPAVAIPDPSLHFDVVTRAGTGATGSVSSLSFQPDLYWGKARNNARDHGLYDSVRGVNKALRSNGTTAEVTETNAITAFNSNGYSFGSSAGDDQAVNLAADTYVDWLWKAGGTASSNTAGSITSTVSANTTAGFSIVTYTGTGANATVGHGLGVAPKMVIAKNRSIASAWRVHHTSLTSGAYTLYFDTSAQTSAATDWNSTFPTSTVFSLGSNNGINGNGNSHIAYCFSEISGYSKFGSYTGNGSTDGPFVHCGFLPRFILMKNASVGSTYWIMFDTARRTYNVMNTDLRANTADAESTGTGWDIDVTANGFKVRNANTSNNGSTNTIIYAAFAEHPFGGSNVSPAPAR